MVGAPQEVRAANQTGGLYQCDYSTGTCEPIRLQGESLPLAGTQGYICTHLDMLGIAFDLGPGGGDRGGPPPLVSSSPASELHAGALRHHSVSFLIFTLFIYLVFLSF